MNELNSWPPALLAATVCFVGAAVALPIAIGYLTSPGFGWLTLFVELLIFAKQMHEQYTEEKEQMRERDE